MKIEATNNSRVLLANVTGFVLALSFLLAACGPTTSINLTLATDSLVVLLGGSEDVEVSLVRNGDTAGAVGLNATGGPDWVTVSFNPATLDGATLTSTMTIATDAGHPEAEPGSFNLTVTATGAGLSASAQLAVTVEQFDVNGTVIDGVGEPLAGLTVYLPGQPIVISAADGSFSFDNVTPPYDLTIADTVAGIAHTFVGLTTPAPFAQPLGALITNTNEFNASVSGNLVNATLIPVPAQHEVRVCVEGIDRPVVNSCKNYDETSTSFTGPADWSGNSSSASARIRAVMYQVDAEGEPTNIVATGVSPVFSLDDTVAVAQDVTLTATTSQAVVDTTAIVPIGYSPSTRQLVAHYSDVASMSLASAVGPSTTREVVAPFFSGIDYSVLIGAISNVPSSNSTTIAWSTGHAPGDSVSLTLPRPAVQVSPPDAATGVTEATEFSLVNQDGGVVTLIISAMTSGTNYVITTDDSSAQIPDLAAIGMALPSSIEYTWTALTRHDVLTVDAAVTGDGYLAQFVQLSNASSGGGPGPESGGSVSTSEYRSFMTQ